MVSLIIRGGWETVKINFKFRSDEKVYSLKVDGKESERILTEIFQAIDGEKKDKNYKRLWGIGREEVFIWVEKFTSRKNFPKIEFLAN